MSVVDRRKKAKGRLADPTVPERHRTTACDLAEHTLIFSSKRAGLLWLSPYCSPSRRRRGGQAESWQPPWPSPGSGTHPPPNSSIFGSSQQETESYLTSKHGFGLKCLFNLGRIMTSVRKELSLRSPNKRRRPQMMIIWPSRMFALFSPPLRYSPPRYRSRCFS